MKKNVIMKLAMIVMLVGLLGWLICGEAAAEISCQPRVNSLDTIYKGCTSEPFNDRIDKTEIRALDWPGTNATGDTNARTTGVGRCGNNLECYPLFYSPFVQQLFRDASSWNQTVASRRVESAAIHEDLTFSPIEVQS